VRVGLFPLAPTDRGATGAHERSASTVVIPSVEKSHRCDYLTSYFHRVAMPKAAAIAPIPIKMFQFPKSLIKGTDWPAM
jgi:hypothetical protein